MEISKYISELLYEHDCVIVPGFGGFVADYQPAKVHPVQHIFTAPSKKIAFNKNLVNNDGLLTNYISHSENISYKKAQESIISFSEKCRLELKLSGKIKIENVGTLFLDIEKKLLFEADTSVNFLRESFGLTSVQSSPVKREGIYVKLEKGFKSAQIPKVPARKTWVKKYGWKAAVLIPVAGLISWAAMQPELMSNVQFNYSYLNPFGNFAPVGKIFGPAISFPETFRTVPDEDVPSHVLNMRKLIQPAANEKEESVSITVNETDFYADFSVTPPLAESVENNAPEISEPIVKHEAEPASSVVSELSDEKFHVIAGCFEIHENAEKLVAKLRAKGYPAAIIGSTRKGLEIVRYSSFSSRSEAASALSLIKADKDSTAWLYVK